MILAEVTLVSPLLVNSRLIVLATLCERLAKLAMPPIVVALKEPCNVPLPALRTTLTTEVLLAVHRLP